MSVLSKSCVYGLRAALYVASFRKERRYVPIREMSEKLDISFHFLTKILQQLTEAGIMTSYRGPNGGVALVRPLAEVKLMDIVRAIDGDDLFKTCILGLRSCSSRHPCPLHKTWASIRGDLGESLETMTLDSFRGQVMKSEFHLADVVRARPEVVKAGR